MDEGKGVHNPVGFETVRISRPDKDGIRSHYPKAFHQALQEESGVHNGRINLRVPG